MSGQAADLSPPSGAPNRRRIIRISDSDSDCDAIKHLNNSGTVAERERRVRYLVRHFPNAKSFEIYEVLSNAEFDLPNAIALLKRTHGSDIQVVDYDHWKLQDKLTKQQSLVNENSGAVKRAQPEKKKASKAKRRRVDHSDDDSNDASEKYQDRVFDSDEDSDVEITDYLTADKKRVLEFMQTATLAELQLMQACSKKKADAILACRPVTGWVDLVQKLQSSKHLSSSLLNAAQRVIVTRNNIKALMKKCSNIAGQLEQAVKHEGAIKCQPSLITPTLKLTNYQLVGLNWLAILHEQGLNGILADEMGLGKTVQVIAFLAYLKERNAAKTTHLIVVPASTLDNWRNEIARWCPQLRVLLYYGSAEDRRSYRFLIAEGKHKEFDIILTTYTVAAGAPEERKMFRVTPMHYVVFDEAHMLKNMNTQRYTNLSRIKATSRLLLTGTPLQNNLLELMSLLIFVMPKIFSEKTEDLKSLFQKTNKLKDKEETNVPAFEREQIEQAKRIMKPFVLRRLKSDVLQDLPKKTDTKLMIPMISEQEAKYVQLVADFQVAGNSNDCAYSGIAMTTDLRKLANHPLLLRYHYKYEDLPELAKRLAKDPDYKDTVEKYIIDDLACMSDFDINQMTKQYLSIRKFSLPKELVLESGKFKYLDKKLPELLNGGHRVLIFSQYVIILNILEKYMLMRQHKFLRLDGMTPVTIRQELIDEFTNDPSIFAFLLSTRAGGLGINLTAADTVIIHDIDFNPYNDKQAEDRCHRMGQSKPVQIIRLVSQDTIEEGMWELAQEKLKLEREITSDDYENTDIKSVVSLLSTALKMDQVKVTNLVSPVKMIAAASKL